MPPHVSNTFSFGCPDSATTQQPPPVTAKLLTMHPHNHSISVAASRDLEWGPLELSCCRYSYPLLLLLLLRLSLFLLLWPSVFLLLCHCCCLLPLQL